MPYLPKYRPKQSDAFVGEKPTAVASRRYWITVPDAKPGRYIHLPTGTTDRATAEAMEDMLRMFGRSGSRQMDLVDAVLTKRCTLGRLFDHHQFNTLHVLRAELEAQRTDIDLAPYVETWRATIAQRHAGESIRKYRRWSQALFPLGDDGRVESALRSVVADPGHIADVLERLPGSNTNRRRHHECFTAIFAYLVDKRVMKSNPMHEVAKAKRVKREQPHIARLTDVLALVAAMPDARMRAIAALAEGGGMEMQAILAMRPIDVLNVSERIVFAHGSKNVYRDRQVVIDAELWPQVMAYVESSGALPLALLFDISEWRVRQAFRETCEALRARHVPIPEGYAPHKARHTYTIRHLEAGDDPTLIAENLGHADVSTMFRDYAKYRPKATEIRRAAREAQRLDTGTGPTVPASAVAQVSAQVKPPHAARSLNESPNTMTAKRLGRAGKERVGLPPVDSNHPPDGLTEAQAPQSDRKRTSDGTGHDPNTQPSAQVSAQVEEGD
ncbi:MAG TPA: tyrosine-type recombinase/integrase [Gemmatimonadaceae bacterium]